MTFTILANEERWPVTVTGYRGSVSFDAHTLHGCPISGTTWVVPIGLYDEEDQEKMLSGLVRHHRRSC